MYSFVWTYLNNDCDLKEEEKQDDSNIWSGLKSNIDNSTLIKQI